jgi:ribosomal protein S19
MVRGSRKPPYVAYDVYKALKKNPTPELRQKLVIKTRSLATVILPSMVGVKFVLYNGKDYNTVLNVKPEYVYCRLADFVVTHKHPVHPTSTTKAPVTKKGGK